MQVSLVMVSADGSSKEVAVPSLPVVLGRDEASKLRIPSASVSRRHCELLEDDDELVIRDLDSSNGTFVNGQKIKKTELAPGDVLSVGPVVFVVRIDGFPKEVDAKEAHAAGAVATGGGGAEPSRSEPPTRMMSGGGSEPRPGTKAAPGPAGKPKGNEDDSFADLLAGLGLDDDDEDRPGKKR